MNLASAVCTMRRAAWVTDALLSRSGSLQCVTTWLAWTTADVQKSLCSARACAGPHGDPAMWAQAPCACTEILGHRGDPLTPCTAPRAERALRGHQGVPSCIALRCAASMRLTVLSSGMTTRAGYGINESEYAFHIKHLLPTEELATAMRSALVSIRPTDLVHTWYARRALMFAFQ